MHKIAVALVLGLAAASVHALPIVFTSSTYTTTALADVDGTLDAHADDTGLAALPLISSASVDAGGGNLAAAHAVADALLLAASSEAASTGASASAAATTTFLGVFTTGGTGLSLEVLFEDLLDALGGASAGAELFVLLQVDGVDLFQDSFSATELIQATFMTLPGLAGVLDLTLVSTAAADRAGSGFNLASASFALNSVPEPASLALVLGGLGLLGVGRRGLGRQRSA